MNLFTLLDRTARQWPDAGAVFSGTECLQTWGVLRTRALQLGQSLHQTVAPASRIALASENCPQFLELMFGTWVAEQAVVPINYKLHAREMAQIIDDADPALIFASPALAPGLLSVLEPARQDRLVVIG
jgi:acyl-CoA synthetase (AMP-forming)/AMP-acid ligase II